MQNVDALGIWQRASAAETSLSRGNEVMPQRFQTYGFNASAFQTLAARTVHEQDWVLDARTAGELIFLPTPDGTFSRFRIVESSVMAPELAAKFPKIKTYRGQGIDDSTATVRLSFTPSGFQGQVFSEAGAYYIDPRGGNYIAYYKRDLPAPVNSGPRSSESVDLSQRLMSDGSPFAARLGCTCLLCSAGQIADPSERAVVLAMGASVAGSLPFGGSGSAVPELAARSGTQLRTYQTAIATTVTATGNTAPSQDHHSSSHPGLVIGARWWAASMGAAFPLIRECSLWGAIACGTINSGRQSTALWVKNWGRSSACWGRSP